MSSNIEAVVLCGGRGRRLGALTARTPKPLLSVAGKPLLIRALEQLERFQVRRFIFVGQYRRTQIEYAIESHAWQSDAPPEITWVEQRHPESEGAVLTGATMVGAPRAIVRCGDDLLSDSTVRRLLESGGAGGVMTRQVHGTSLARLGIDGARITGTTHEEESPIMTYNLCLDTDLLRRWSRSAVNSGRPMVQLIDDFVPKDIRAVDGSNSVGLNTVADLPRVAAWLAAGHDRA